MSLNPRPVSRLITERDFSQSAYNGMVSASGGASLRETIIRAEAIIEGAAGRRFTAEPYVETFYRHRGDKIFLRHRPIVNVLAVRYRYDPRETYQAFPLGHVYVEPRGAAGVLEFDPYESHKLHGNEVRVEFVAGWPKVPSDVKQAVIMQTALLLYNDPEMTAQGDGRPPGFLGYFQKNIDAIVARYRIGSFL